MLNIGPSELIVVLVTPLGGLLAAGYLAVALWRNARRG